MSFSRKPVVPPPKKLFTSDSSLAPTMEASVTSASSPEPQAWSKLPRKLRAASPSMGAMMICLPGSVSTLSSVVVNPLKGR